MLRANDNGNVYGFIGEGGHLDFHNIPENFGEVVLKVSCDNGFEKRGLTFGTTSVQFVFTKEDIDQIGVGEHPYRLILIDEDGNRSTLIPDSSTSTRPTFNIEE